jgi:hypothetical protein
MTRYNHAYPDYKSYCTNFGTKGVASHVQDDESVYCTFGSAEEPAISLSGLASIAFARMHRARTASAVNSIRATGTSPPVAAWNDWEYASTTSARVFPS